MGFWQAGEQRPVFLAGRRLEVGDVRISNEARNPGMCQKGVVVTSESKSLR